MGVSTGVGDHFESPQDAERLLALKIVGVSARVGDHFESPQDAQRFSFCVTAATRNK